MSPPYDAIVVGAGAGGGLASYALTRAGLRVLLIERGPAYDPARDYPIGRPDWDLGDTFARSTPDTYVVEPQPLAADGAHLRTTLYRHQTTQREYSYQRACGVGGSTLHFLGEAHRFPPHAFRMRSLYGVGRDWPLTYEELAPYYGRVERLLGVAGQAHPLFPRTEPFPNPPHPLSPVSQRFAAGARRLGRTLVPNSLAILSRPYAGRPPCVYCKACYHGCVVGDKSSVDVAVLPEAQRTGRLTVATGSVVTHVLLDRRGEAEGIRVLEGADKVERIHRARLLFLAAGAIETPRLLLNSRSPRFPHGLLNDHGLVGTHLMENVYIARLYYFPERLASHRGVPIDAHLLDFVTPSPAGGCPQGFSLSSYGAPDGLKTPASFALSVPSGHGRLHRERVARHFGAHAMILGLAEQLPRQENRLHLLNDQPDAHGVPRVAIEVRFTADDRRMLERMVPLCDELATASGVAATAGQVSSYDLPNNTHPCGTVAMGVGPEDSVVNGFCQSHAVRNLYVTDASVLPTQGCGMAPSLTVEALALRAAEYAVSASKGG